MLNRQIQVKISLLRLTGAANVKQVLPNAPDSINFEVPSLGDFVFGMPLCSENATRLFGKGEIYFSLKRGITKIAVEKEIFNYVMPLKSLL